MHPLDHPDRLALFQANTNAVNAAVFVCFVAGLTTFAAIAAIHIGNRNFADVIVLILVAICVIIVQLWFDRTVRRKEKANFILAGSIETTLKVAWIQLLAWALPPNWDFAAATVLSTLLVGWAIGEAIYLFDAAYARVAWAIGLSTLPVYWFLSGFLLDRANSEVLETSRYTSFFAAIILLQLAAQGIFGILGRDARLQQEARDRLRDIESENQTLKSERETISRVAKVLSGTVAGQRLRHDAASPMQVMGFGLDALAEEESPEERAEILGDMRQALASLESLVTSLRTDNEEDVGNLSSVEGVVERTLNSVRGTLLGHQVKAATVRVELENAEVWTGPEHPVAIASLICNASLLAPDLPVSLRGRVVNPYFYRLEIRDQAAIGEAQRTAFERVRLGLRLRRMGTDSRGGRWRGMGIGLPLCRLQLSRHGSWVDVSLPETGPGLVLQVIMPRVEPATIPESENTPERWVIA